MPCRRGWIRETVVTPDPVVHLRMAKALVVSNRLSGNSSLILFRNIGDNVRFKCGRRLYRLFFIVFLVFSLSLLFADFLDSLFILLFSIMHEFDESPNIVDL